MALILVEFRISFDIQALAHFYFVFLVFIHIITLSTFFIYLCSQKDTIEHIKLFIGIDYCYNGLDTPFSENLSEFFLFLHVVSTLTFQSYQNYWMMTAIIGFLGAIIEPIFCFE